MRSICLAMLASVVIAAPALAQPRVYVNAKGQVFFNVTCSPSRQRIATGQPLKTGNQPPTLSQPTLSAPLMNKPTTPELQKLYNQIADNRPLLRQALKSTVPEYRFTGIYAIAIKKQPMHEELIEMLGDAHPSVALAARQALTVLTADYGRREDFGPLARATSEQVRESQGEWRKWFDARREYLKNESGK